MADAIQQASTDAGLSSVPDPDALRVVSLLSWRYRDPARFVAEHLRVAPRRTALSAAGGNSPQLLVNHAAAQIQRGDLDLVILTGAEAWRTRMRARREGVELWARVPEDVAPDEVIGAELPMGTPEEIAAGVVAPIQVYPMFETALRAEAGESVEHHQEAVSELWARFSAVAATNPNAWLRTALTAEQIRTPGPSNRMIGLPYPKYMNSNNDVDMGAAVILCSVERARRLGVAKDRWVFPHSGADCHEHLALSTRWSFTRTPAIEIGGRTALELAGVGIDDVAIVDLYSCFPSAVQLGARSLGLGLDRQLTRTGGLSFAGGPWNDYVMHAIATVVTDLREQPGERGLVWANGGFVTKHSFGVYSTRPPGEGFRHESPQAAIDALPRRDVAGAPDAAGPATIEAYTVLHDRAGAPERAFAACLLPDGRRAWASSDDPQVTSALCDGEWVGAAVVLDGAGHLRPG